MPEEPAVHKTDLETFRGGVLILAICLVVAPLATAIGAQLAFPLSDNGLVAFFALFVPGVLGLFGIAFGIWAVRVPTGNGSVRIAAEGLRLTLRGNRTVEIPWTDTASWGIVHRRWNWTTSLVVRPAGDASEKTRSAARRLWSKRHAGWVIEAMEPPPEIIADFERLAPVPRRDDLASRRGGTA